MPINCSDTLGSDCLRNLAVVCKVRVCIFNEVLFYFFENVILKSLNFFANSKASKNRVSNCTQN